MDAGQILWSFMDIWKKLILKTLKQLKEKYDKLLKECNILYEEIHTLEEQETFKKVKVGDCFLAP